MKNGYLCDIPQSEASEISHYFPRLTYPSNPGLRFVISQKLYSLF